MTLPAARTVASFWRRLFRRRPRLITRCARCGAARDGQKLPSLPAERIVCSGTVDMAMPGEKPWIVCIRLERRLG